jgi:hypothetical protein
MGQNVRITTSHVVGTTWRESTDESGGRTMPDPVKTVDDAPIEVRETPPAVRDDATPAPRATDRIPADVAVGLAVAWFVGYSLVLLLEPATSHSLPVIGVVLGTAFLVGILLTAAGLVARQRWGVTASLATAVLLVASSVACPTTGHHSFGLWWFGQMAVAVALVAASAVALRRT